MTTETTGRSNIYQTITTRIADAIADGADSFQMPWHTNARQLPVNAYTDASYRGINVLTLWLQLQLRGYGSSHWASYRQWKALGAQVRQGERGSLIIFYKELERDVEQEAPRYVAKSSYVFNVDQVDGWRPPPQPTKSEGILNEEVEGFVRATEAIIRHGSDRACYRPGDDCIDIPHREAFVGSWTRTATQAYYGVLLHELVHWSGAAHRLNRVFGERFGDRSYAFEELIAELGAAFLCARLGVANEVRPDHAAYVSSWLKILDRDPKAIFAAARNAQDAVEYLINLAAARTLG